MDINETGKSYPSYLDDVTFSHVPHEAPLRRDPRTENQKGISAAEHIREFPEELVKVIAWAGKNFMDVYAKHMARARSLKAGDERKYKQAEFEESIAKQSAYAAAYYEEHMANIVLQGLKAGKTTEQIIQELKEEASEAKIDGLFGKLFDRLGIRVRPPKIKFGPR